MGEASSPPLNSYREMIESGTNAPGNPGHQLWLIPIHRSSRQQYYDRAAADVRRHFEKLWESTRDAFESREEFDRTETVDFIWKHSAPPWWGLNDIVGFIDIRLLGGTIRGIWVSLSLPTKRISIRLVHKLYVSQRHEVIRLDETRAENAVIRERLIEVVEVVRGHKRLKRLHVDLEQWKLAMRHTDILGIIRATETQQ